MSQLRFYRTILSRNLIKRQKCICNCNKSHKQTRLLHQSFPFTTFFINLSAQIVQYIVPMFSFVVQLLRLAYALDVQSSLLSLNYLQEYRQQGR